MLYLIYSVVGVVAGALILMRMSDGLADSFSRGVESVFDEVEYRLASRAEQG